MNSINQAKIVINPNRQRQEFDENAHQELKNSIELQGLFHPVVLREEGPDYVLVAGERRLRAIQEIYELGGNVRHNNRVYFEGEIPFVTLGELSYLEAEEAELDENLRRQDLTWQEHASAVKRLHELRQAQREQVANLAPSYDDVEILPIHQSIADTAQELHGRSDGSYQDSVRTELIVARHLDNPAVQAAKSAKEALKILKMEEQAAKNRELAKIVGATFSVDKHKAYNVDCLTWMRNYSGELFDVILTDPPFGMNAQNFGDGAGRFVGIEHHYSDTYEDWQKLMRAWCVLAYTVTKPQAHAYVFCDFDRFHELKEYMVDSGWYVFRTPMINVKTNSGRVPIPDRGPSRQWEMLLYAIKGNKQVTHIYPDIITTIGDENMSHGAQKPVALYQNLLQRSIRPGDRILDTFAGTGTIFPACHTLSCEATGLELNPEYYGMCLKRLEEIKNESTLFPV
jgi:site-specific DNA-methyltransferase (adenine-specific)